MLPPKARTVWPGLFILCVFFFELLQLQHVWAVHVRAHGVAPVSWDIACTDIDLVNLWHSVSIRCVCEYSICQWLSYISLSSVELLRDEREGLLCLYVNGWFLVSFGGLCDFSKKMFVSFQKQDQWCILLWSVNSSTTNIRIFVCSLQEPTIPSFSPLKLSQGIV